MKDFINNSGWSLLSQGIRVLTQAGLFILLARGFGVDDFGNYIAIFSISQLFYPLSGLGTHNTLVMRVSRAPQLLKHYYLTPILSVLIIGSMLVSALFYIIDSIYTVSAYVVFSILLTELVAYRLLDVATHAWQAVENLKKVAISYLLISVLRVILAGSLMLVGRLDLTLWATSNVILTSVFALLLNYLLIKKRFIL
ncbi:lipopolysaccharide biosynthesis protein [Cobetia marina]